MDVVFEIVAGLAKLLFNSAIFFWQVLEVIAGAYVAAHINHDFGSFV